MDYYCVLGASIPILYPLCGWMDGWVRSMEWIRDEYRRPCGVVIPCEKHLGKERVLNGTGRGSYRGTLAFTSPATDAETRRPSCCGCWRVLARLDQSEARPFHPSDPAPGSPAVVVILGRDWNLR